MKGKKCRAAAENPDGGREFELLFGAAAGGKSDFYCIIFIIVALSSAQLIVKADGPGKSTAGKRHGFDFVK
jgi:hypothetical protein